MRKLLAYCAALSLAATAACTVHQDNAPTPSGPSTSAIALTVTATPDTLPQNGTSQARVMVRAFNAGGQPLASLPIRLDMQVNGTTRDLGTLSARSIVTAADGTASATYTAPAGPNAGGDGTLVAFVATVMSGDAVNQGLLSSVGSQSQAFVRLVADSLVNPAPPETPTAVFSTGGTLTAGAIVLFNGTASCPSTATSGVCNAANSTLTSWDWDFGDNSTHGNGSVATHAYSVARAYAVTLRVTNSQGNSASSTSVVTIAAGTNPVALFTALPNPASVNSAVTLDGSPSTGQIVNYAWTITSPTAVVTRAGGTSSSTNFTPNAVGAWTVTLTVTDVNGRSNTSAATTVNVQ